MLGSAVVVGQAVASAVTGVVVDRLGPETALACPPSPPRSSSPPASRHRAPTPQPAEPPELVHA